jgi:hypothetical protein
VAVCVGVGKLRWATRAPKEVAATLGSVALIERVVTAVVRDEVSVVEDSTRVK